MTRSWNGCYIKSLRQTHSLFLVPGIEDNLSLLNWFKLSQLVQYYILSRIYEICVVQNEVGVFTLVIV